MEAAAEEAERLVEVAEREVVFDFKPGVKCRAVVHLRSLHPSLPVAFKVQTSSPHRFLVNPAAALLPPLSSAAIRLVLRPQPLPPPHFPRSLSDRFLIKASLAATPPPPLSGGHDVKLNVAYVGPFLLLHAASLADVAAARALLRRQKDLIFRLSPADSAALLRSASALPDPSLLRLLLDSGLRAPPAPREAEGLDPRDGEGQTSALHRAAANGDVEAVRRLLELGADASVANGRGRTPLDVARDKGHEEVVAILELGETALTAARRGDVKRLESLLKRNAGILHAHDQYGMTALHAAAVKGHRAAVSLLLDAGMGVECEDVEGHTPLHLAVESGCVETVEVLVDMGANLNARTRRGATPLCMATTMGNEAISQLLLSRGASSASFVASSSSSSTLCAR